jgi:hypothetical protein
MWEREDGHVECRLATGKTQVAPRVKITVPRMEQGEILYGLLGCPEDAENGTRKVQQIFGARMSNVELTSDGPMI